MSRIALDNVTLNTRIDGDEGRSWIILSNSLGTNLSMWDGQIALLTQKYRVLRYDHRGHGQSDTPQGPYSWEQLTEDVIGLMDALGIDRADWMGLSMGSMTGMGLGINHGDRFGKLVLADGRADAPDPSMWDGRIQAIRNGGVAAVAEASLGMWLTADWRAANPEATDRMRAMLLATDPDGYIACCQGLKTLDYLKDAGRIGNEALCITGSDDKGASPEVVQAIAKAIPNASYVEVPSSAHISNVNNPAAFNAAIAKFLGISA